MSSKVRNIFRINRKSLFATLGGFETPGAFLLGYTWIWSTVFHISESKVLRQLIRVMNKYKKKGADFFHCSRLCSYKCMHQSADKTLNFSKMKYLGCTLSVCVLGPLFLSLNMLIKNRQNLCHYWAALRQPFVTRVHLRKRNKGRR